jgi:hypothetical protein
MAGDIERHLRGMLKFAVYLCSLINIIVDFNIKQKCNKFSIFDEFARQLVAYAYSPSTPYAMYYAD